jgi:hypothetical protein
MTPRLPLDRSGAPPLPYPISKRHMLGRNKLFRTTLFMRAVKRVSWLTLSIGGFNHPARCGNTDLAAKHERDKVTTNAPGVCQPSRGSTLSMMLKTAVSFRSLGRRMSVNVEAQLLTAGQTPAARQPSSEPATSSAASCLWHPLARVPTTRFCCGNSDPRQDIIDVKVPRALKVEILPVARRDLLKCACDIR